MPVQSFSACRKVSSVPESRVRVAAFAESSIDVVILAPGMGMMYSRWLRCQARTS